MYDKIRRPSFYNCGYRNTSVARGRRLYSRWYLFLAGELEVVESAVHSLVLYVVIIDLLTIELQQLP